jgi:hypothetical protein
MSPHVLLRLAHVFFTRGSPSQSIHGSNFCQPFTTVLQSYFLPIISSRLGGATYGVSARTLLRQE